jgi:putative DNA primase/helicase
VANSSSTTTDPAEALKAILEPHHYRELIEGSAIDPAVALERGYVSVRRPDKAGNQQTIPGVHGSGVGWMDTREQLKRLGFPSWSVREDYYFPGLLLPIWTPGGKKIPGQWKPWRAVPSPDGKGKRIRYASARGGVRLDVHPRWSRDPDPDGREMRLPAIQDVDVPLWITEGLKKADALTSRGICTVALSGVYNWRNTHATLGDWEDVRLKGREVTICFDADAITKPAVQKAMARLGKWLKFKGASKVWYLVVPPGVNDQAVKGVDDFFAAGGTVTQLEQAYSTKPPKEISTSDTYTDARLAETLAEEVLDGRYVWAAGLDWLGWDGRKWSEVHEVTVIESVRQWALDQFAEAAARLRDMDESAGADVEGLRPMLGASRQKAVLGLARGIVERKAEDFDSDPDLLNTPDGVVHIPTGDTLPHDPDLLMTKITKGSYRPGFRHEDWDQALQALPEECRDWYRVRMGQAVTGYTTSDGRVLVLQGGGDNGKSALTTDGFLHAVGTYGMVASQKLLMGSKNEHSTEIADLRGHRFVVVEELVEEGSINVGALKRLADVSRVRARRTHKDNMEFQATHTLIATTNPMPVVKETDHGTWRRLCMVKFPFRWVAPGRPLGPGDRVGDPTLKRRLIDSPTGQHDAMITWAVEGAMEWHANREALARKAKGIGDILTPPERVQKDTLDWRVLSDRILGFWRDCLVADSTASVWVGDLLDHFNEWLRANGHSPWARETFGPKFESHQETSRHRVTKKRTRDHSAIMRRPVPGGFGAVLKDLPKQAEVWLGVRFRDARDDADSGSDQG